MLTYFCGKSVFSALRASVVKNALAIQTLKSKTYTTWPFQRQSFPVISRSKSVNKNVCLLFVSTPISCWSSTRKFPHISVNLTQTGSLRGLSQFVHGQPVLAAVRTFSTTAHRFAPSRGPHGSSNKTGLIYIIAVFIFMLGGAYAGVPLYKVFCQATGLGGQAVKGHDTDKVETMEPVERPITVRFNADVASSMRWNFKPQQNEVTVNPGETALAFYTAYNPTDKPIIGISTYNVLPFDAGQYFNKIQCFCFEEQRLNPKEQVDMPVFFYIDPEFVEDPKLEHVDIITLSYTFFEAREGLVLPLPGYPQPHNSPAVAAS